MPLALLALTPSAFALGITEFIIAGFIPPIATHLSASLPSASLLVSLYTLGAMELTVLTGRLDRRAVVQLKREEA